MFASGVYSVLVSVVPSLICRSWCSIYLVGAARSCGYVVALARARCCLRHRLHPRVRVPAGAGVPCAAAFASMSVSVFGGWHLFLLGAVFSKFHFGLALHRNLVQLRLSGSFCSVCFSLYLDCGNVRCWLVPVGSGRIHVVFFSGSASICIFGMAMEPSRFPWHVVDYFQREWGMVGTDPVLISSCCVHCITFWRRR